MPMRPPKSMEKMPSWSLATAIRCCMNLPRGIWSKLPRTGRRDGIGIWFIVLRQKASGGWGQGPQTPRIYCTYLNGGLPQPLPQPREALLRLHSLPLHTPSR